MSEPLFWSCDDVVEELTHSDMDDAIEQHLYPKGAFDQMVNAPSTIIHSLDDLVMESTLTLLAQGALERIRPCRGGRWVRDPGGRFKIEPKPTKSIEDLTDVAAVWVHYESTGGGRGKELIKLSVEERDGEFVLEGRRW